MISERQKAYLAAMDIGVWQLRESPSPPLPGGDQQPGLSLGPGNSGVLLICGADEHSASRLANDIGRTLGQVPVWAWPAADSGSVTGLRDAIEENLFTTVAFFGESLARQFLEDELPPAVGSAKLVVLPSMEDIRSHPKARKELWSVLCQNGMAGC